MKNNPTRSSTRPHHLKTNTGATVFSRRLLCAALILGASCANAADVRWKGGAGTTADWFTATNWDTGAAPGSGDFAILNAGLPDGFSPVIDGGNVQLARLIIGTNSYQSLSILNSNTVVSGDLSIGAANGAGFMYLGANASLSTASATIGVNSTGGTVDLVASTSTWVNSGALNIGDQGAGEGTLRIYGGSSVTSDTVAIGVNSTNGKVTIDGAGSTLNATSGLKIGYFDTGDLRIQNAGTVNSGASEIGSQKTAGPNPTTAVGTVTVTGAGSTWNTTTLSVGLEAKGTLTITDGGLVHSSAVSNIAADAGSEGTVDVTGAGSRWTLDSALFVGNGGRGILTITDGGVVQGAGASVGQAPGNISLVGVSGAGSKWVNSGLLIVGNGGEGRLFLTGGGVVENTDAIIGHFEGSTGLVGVSGVNSTWTNTGTLTIGDQGSGTLGIDSGATVTSARADIGLATGGEGTVTVNGVGSKWTNTGDLSAGRSGKGTLAISNGGTVTSITGNLGGYPTEAGEGIATVDGAGSRWGISESLLVGYGGNGTLTVSNGGVVEAASTYIGYERNSGAVGSVTISGTGSRLSSGDLTVGHGAQGDLAITSGGVVELGNFCVIANEHTAVGKVTVDGAGSKLSTGATSNLIIGYNGSGTLEITNGGEVSSGKGYIGISAGSVGTVTVGGAGSKWAMTDALTVGSSGKGALTVETGGKVVSGVLNIGGPTAGESTGEGEVTVTGAGTVLDSDYTTVGYFGKGTLTIGAGGRVLSDSHSNVGLEAGSVGTAHIAGADSLWYVDHSLTIGARGAGELLITAGGLVEDESASIGREVSAVGTVTVDGVGSKWTHLNNLIVGDSGQATLAISNGGVVTTGTSGVVIAKEAGSTGTLNIGAASGAAPVAPGTLESPTVTFGAGTGSIVFNHTATDYVFAPDIEGAGEVVIRSGTTTLSGNNTYTGGTRITGGTLLMGSPGALGAGPLTIGSGGTFDLGGTAASPTATTLSQITLLAGATLRGSGSFGSLVNNGGTVSPGHSPGTIVLAGDFVNNGGVLDIEIEGTGAGQFDQIRYAGRAIIAPGSTLNITFLAGYIPTLGDNISFLLDTDPSTGPAVTGDFDTKNLPALAPGLRAAIVTTSTGINFVVFSSTLAGTPGFTPHDGLAGFIDAIPGNTTAADALGALGVTQGGAALSQAVTNASPIGLSGMDALVIDENRRTGEFLRARAQTDTANRSGDWTAFATGHGAMTDWDDDRDTGTFDQNFFGGKAGLAKSLGAGLSAGVALGYDSGTAHLHNDGGKISQDRGSATAYVAHDLGGDGFAYAGLSGGYSGFDTRRDTVLGREEGDTHGVDLGVAAGIGYKVKLTETFDTTPYAGINYSLSRYSAFDESGSALALHVRSRSTESLRLKVGDDIGWTLPVGADAIRLSLGVAFEHELLDDDTAVNAAFRNGSGAFSVRGDTLSRNTITVGPTIAYSFAGNQSVSLGYSYEYGLAGTESNRFDAAYTVRF